LTVEKPTVILFNIFIEFFVVNKREDFFKFVVTTMRQLKLVPNQNTFDIIGKDIYYKKMLLRIFEFNDLQMDRRRERKRGRRVNKSNTINL